MNRNKNRGENTVGVSLWSSVAMPSNPLIRGTFSRLLKRIRLLLLLYRSSPRDAPHERCKVPSCDIHTLQQLPFLPPDFDFSIVNNSDASPQRLVDAVRNFKPFLPIRCEVFGRGDLTITGSRPIAAGGWGDVWVGEMNGTMVAIKSYRYNASSSRLPVYLVGDEHQPNVHFSLKVSYSGCIGKCWRVTTSTAATKALCPS